MSQNKIKNDQTQNKNHFIQLKHDLFETKEKNWDIFPTQKWQIMYKKIVYDDNLLISYFDKTKTFFSGMLFDTLNIHFVNYQPA